MTDAQEPVVDCIIGYRKERRLSGANLPLANEIAGRHVNPIVSVDVIADGEHRIGGSVGSGRLHQLNKAVSVAEIKGIDCSNTAITGAGDILQQWSNLEALRGFSQRHTRVGETTKQIGVPLGCVERIIIEVIADNRCCQRTWKCK